MTTMDFGAALAFLKNGYRVTRKGWNGRNQWLHLQRPDVKSKMQLPYIYIKTEFGKLVPWTPSQSDLLEMDWVLAN